MNSNHDIALTPEVFLDLIAPHLTKLEQSRPSGLDPEAVKRLSLDDVKSTVLPHLTLWLDWAHEYEEFLWSYGCGLFGAEGWELATNSAEAYKARIRSIRDAIRNKNYQFLQSHGLLDGSRLNYEALYSILDDARAKEPLQMARETVDQLQRWQETPPLLLCDSPISEEPFDYQYQDEIKAKLPDIQVSLKDIEWSPFKATPTTPSTRNLVAGHWEQYTPLVDEVMLWKSNNCRIDWSDGWDKHDVQKEMDARAET
ncbi:hypothetical protein FRB99_003786, partial [Tulasnella sp. 403]